MLHLIRGGIGSPLQLICQSVLVTYGIRPLVDSNGSNLNIVDWQGNVVSIAILLPTSLALSVITVIKVNICNYKREGIYFGSACAQAQVLSQHRSGIDTGTIPGQARPSPGQGQVPVYVCAK